nr:fumarylacetoacetate hydrolase family protein [uncultured Cohaesibacter sp.]
MKLFRFGPKGAAKPGMLDAEGRGRDLSSVIPDLGPEQLSDEALARLTSLDPMTLPLVPEGARVDACIGDVPRFFCIGLNYSDHAEESGMAIPDFPILFTKVCEATGANDPVTIPKGSTKTDWEVELGVILGKGGAHIALDDALCHVAGYCVVNDISERSFQIEHGGQWVKGKSCDGFGPIGPYLVTRDEVLDPQALDLWLDVNGTRMQTGNTKMMIFTVAEIIAHLSTFFTLRAGDVITTGTPPGVGMGRSPQVFLKAGDEVRLGVEGLGEQTQRFVAFGG